MFHVDAEVFTNGEFQKLHEKKKNLKYSLMNVFRISTLK